MKIKSGSWGYISGSDAEYGDRSNGDSAPKISNFVR